jgi:hypothetical protein
MKKSHKIAKCSNCCPTGGAYLTATFDDDMEPCWRCNNCGQETPRKVQKPPDEHSPLTPSQIRAITMIQQHKLHDKSRYEVKRLQIQQYGHFVSVVCEVGVKGDEGTMAALLCRDYGHFIVSRNGAIKATDNKTTTKEKLKKYPLIFGWRH